MTVAASSPVVEAEVTLPLAEALEASGADPATLAVEVTIIRPGVSNNGWRYSEQVLREAAPLFEGAAAFCDHPGPGDLGRAGGRSVRDLVGVYSRVRYAEGLKASLRFYPGAEWLFRVIEASIRDREAGRQAPNIGISGDMLLLWEPVVQQAPGGNPTVIAREVKAIKAVQSADVVFRPSAGGRFERIAEAESQALGGILEGGPDMSNQGTATTTEETTATLEAAREARAQACGELLNVRLQSSQLPPAARELLRSRFKGRAFAANELEAEIESLRSLLAESVVGQTVSGMGAQRSQVRMGFTPLEKVQMAMDRLFGLEVADSSVPRFSGIREAYVRITGDTEISGRYNFADSVLEANEVTTSVMSNVVGVSMNKRLVRDYQAQPKWWLPVVVRTSLRDMKQQTRILLNDFASLSTVNENGAYTNLAWDDSAESFTPAKHGNLVTITLEMVLNDDLRAIQRIPRKLANAAAVTINEFVAALFTANAGTGPLMGDGVTVFHLDHQSNIGTEALSAEALKSGLLALAKMTNSAGKRIGVQGRHLLIPPDLAFTAAVLVNSTLAPGAPVNDVNVLKGLVEPVVVPNWTDGDNWYLLADPAQVECIELGFLNGREEPELLAQTSPTEGAVFTNDALAYKIRWIFGGGWLDYRGAYGSIT